jgi:LacI family transcriptional regulator
MATIKDVARLAGVGVGTASRVVSGRGSFSADAAARVAHAVEQLDFRPSSTARALSLRSTSTIGVYVPGFTGPFYGPMLQTIDTQLREHDRYMVVANGHGHDDVREQALLGAQFLVERECDGIILASNALRDADYVALKRLHPKLAVVNREVKGMKKHCFSVDHVQAGRLAAQAFLERGHKRFAVISGPEVTPDNRERLQGFFDELAEHGIAREQVPLADGQFDAPGGWRATQQLLAQPRRFTALFCANDLMAMAALSCLQAAGRRVPADVSVMGYDDADIAAFLSPRLASVRIAIAGMGLNACRLMLNLCYGTQLPVSHEFRPEVVVRESLGRAPR